MQQAVADALQGFADAPLASAARALLNALGYESNRTAEVGTVLEFLDRYNASDELTERQLALFDHWLDVELVFQLTDDEVDGTARLLVDAPFDDGRIKSFLFIAAELADDAYSRTKLAEMTRAANRLFPMPVVLLFRCAQRFSLAVVHRRPHRHDPSRNVLERVTLVKDVQAQSPHRAHLDTLAELALPRMTESLGVSNFDDLHTAWETTLDTEKLNRRFYRELFRWYERAIRECRFPDDGAGEGSQERQVIRLITRLLFIWFMQEKGLVSDDLFTQSFAASALKSYDGDSTAYYRAVLQNLFFATLNTEITKRGFSKGGNQAHRDFSRYRYKTLLADPDAFLGKLKAVPFVNGGLFDCLDDFESRTAGGRRIDAFTDNPNQGKGLRVPASVLLDDDGLFALFRRFKFTVEENTPLDQEVALDPELLGRVFENLLAAYNPETRKTVRQATGSYYTPRRIVDYLVDEALVAALLERVASTDGDAKYLGERLSYLLDYESAFDDAAEFFDLPEKESIVRAIANLRVLDPAVGSGAFPMGALHKLTLALRRLDPKNVYWERFQKELAANRAAAAFNTRSQDEREAELLDISQTFETYRDSDFGRKLYLIQHGIFGVDLQPVACQIARLRFFISLTVEQQPSQDAARNYGIRPLPNLETRIVAANTLIGVGTPNQMRMDDNNLQRHIDDLARIRERHCVPPPGPTLPLGDICYVSKGMVVHAHERYAPGTFVLEDVVADAEDELHPKPFVEGKHLDRWLPSSGRWIEWGTDRAPRLFSRRTFPERYTVEEKLLSVDMAAGQQDRARVVFDNGQLHHNHSVWSFVPWHSLEGVRNRSIQKQERYPGEKRRTEFPHREKLEKVSQRFHLKYVLGVMNSASALEFLTAHRRSNIHLYPDDWKKLPIPDVPKRQQQPIVRLVDKILTALRTDPDADVSNLERQIDKAVRKHYRFE